MINRNNCPPGHPLPILLASVVAMTLFSACANPTIVAEPSNPIPSESLSDSSSPEEGELDQVSSCLKTIVEQSHQIYGQAQANQWADIEPSLEPLQAELDTLKANPSLPAADISKLESELTALTKATAQQDAEAAMEAANKSVWASLTLLEVVLPYAQTEGAVLGYYGRALEIAVAKNEPSTTQAMADMLQQNWATAKPTVEGRDEATARTLDEAIEQLPTAQSPQEYGAIAQTIITAAQTLPFI